MPSTSADNRTDQSRAITLDDGRMDQVAVELPLEVRINGKPMFVAMRTPGHDDELVRGSLLCEGIVSSVSEIESIVRPDDLVDEEAGNVVDVRLRDGLDAKRVDRLFPISSSCGACGKQSIRAIRVTATPLPTEWSVSLATICELPERLRAFQPLFRETGGAHASALFNRSGQLIVVREDVGRHNALDKVIGWAVQRDRLPLRDCVLLVSGRVSFELVQKAIVAGVPVIVAVGAPSSYAVELARQFNVTLVGFTRPGGGNVYSGSERVIRPGS